MWLLFVWVLCSFIKLRMNGSASLKELCGEFNKFDLCLLSLPWRRIHLKEGIGVRTSLKELCGEFNNFLPQWIWTPLKTQGTFRMFGTVDIAFCGPCVYPNLLRRNLIFLNDHLEIWVHIGKGLIAIPKSICIHIPAERPRTYHLI